ncbi:MAG: UDP-2,3-diacylglucosamine diphosphatase, partial [Gammaproteobacteria bacterium]|nr:UDP-2,3-diacylglucosamine diphosphatase [Gammaproteobacteria bacterium]
MGIYFLSDTHLSPNQPVVYDKFLRYLRSIRKDADELYILGDLFDYWIGDDGSALLGHNPAIEALA